MRHDLLVVYGCDVIFSRQTEVCGILVQGYAVWYFGSKRCDVVFVMPGVSCGVLVVRMGAMSSLDGGRAM